MLFIQDQYQYLTLPSVQHNVYVIGQFAHQEFQILIPADTFNKKCIVIGSLTARADLVVSLLLLLSTLKQSRAAQVVLFSPYLGYQRQDKKVIGISQGLFFADDLLSAVGVDEIVTITPHNLEILHELKTPVTMLSEQLIFQDDLASFVAQGFEFVFPDRGAFLRHRWLLEIFPLAIHHSFEKKRHEEMIELLSFQGSIGSQVIVYDDILDSGQTLVQVCKALQLMGVQEIVIFVTHAFFHGTIWMELFNLGVVALYCTNSLPEAHVIKHERIHVKSISFLLQKII